MYPAPICSCPGCRTVQYRQLLHPGHSQPFSPHGSVDVLTSGAIPSTSALGISVPTMESLGNSQELESPYISTETRHELGKFTGKVGSNYVPSDQEVNLLSELLTEPLAKLQSLDQDIIDTQVHLQKTLAARTHLSSQLYAYRSLLSPVRRLPAEVLREIFLHCLMDQPSVGSMCVKAAPMLLTRVCSSWRAIALSTPRLWSAISISIPSTYVDPRAQVGEAGAIGDIQVTTKRVFGAHEWLGRSGSLDLDITITFMHSLGSSPDTQKAAILFTMITAFSMRWRSFTMTCPSAVLPVLNKFGLQPAQVPNLEHLSIVNPLNLHPQLMAMSAPPMQFEAPFLVQAPNLTSFSFNGASNPANFPLKWGRLTTLKLSSSRGPAVGGLHFATQIFEILKRCPNLVNFYSTHFTAYPVNTTTMDSFQQSLGRIFLPSLEVLSFTGRADISAFLPMLHTPSLTEFAFVCDRSWPAGFGAARLLQFLKNISESLTSFTVDPVAFTRPLFIQTLRTCPDIETLCLTSPAKYASESWVPHLGPQIPPTAGGEMVVDDQFINLLAPDSGDSADALCPSLENFFCRTPVRVTPASLNAFIRRKNAVNGELGSLKNVEVVFADPLSGPPRFPVSTQVAGANLKVTYWPMLCGQPAPFPPPMLQ